MEFSKPKSQKYKVKSSQRVFGTDITNQELQANNLKNKKNDYHILKHRKVQIT